ncbi:acyltransferase family protein [Cellulomonas gilvus]|uniref:Acyltransferase 3 n=1 Tax=Cellulomonas gilvus (strain ATCC 13127 / NRRL B-14078) TaxID=593907 RepID=F8A180_CELGA|nr:acyltransferase family protein [Cellulomonas gilvus]AEI11627.1 acyltransferase 3 [Cellulomonas gilvus ATCC 13127]
MAGTDTVLAQHTPTRGRQGAGFRPDIEGLRAIAVGLVLVYHAGVDQLSGGFVGVDIFFVLSGFLITGLLVRELERSGRVSLSRFYARRAKRLLPATALTLIASALLTWAFIPVTQWRAFGGDIVSAALYVVNWRLADRSVDYLAEGTGASPVQHFWSLAVEEQYYIVWPLLLVLVGLVVRRTRLRVRPTMAVALALIVVPSLVWSVHLTSTQPAVAFFVTTTRLWELGIGAAVAIGAAWWVRVPARVAALAGWAGLAAILASALLFSSATPWPGSAALVPTLGTAAVIVAGFRAAGPARLLALRPLVWIGGMSYSLYLWHWPLVVAATFAAGGELGAKVGLLVTAASVVPAWLSLRLVENPVRFSTWVAAKARRALTVGLACTLVGVLAGVALLLAVPQGPPPPPDTRPEDPRTLVGAEVIQDGGPQAGAPRDTVRFMTPAPTDAVDDVPEAYDRECQVDSDGSEPRACAWGDPDGTLDVAVVGDSKMLQWTSALDEIGRSEGWRVTTWTKSACAFADVVQTQGGKPYESCVAWNDAVLAELTAAPPDVLVTSQRATSAMPPDGGDSSSEAMSAGIERRWQEVAALGTRVVVLLDNPAPPDEVYECVAEHLETLTACAFDRDDAVRSSAASEQLAAATALGDAVGVVDMTPWVCPTTRCAPVIGDVLVYRQGSHLTDTYVRSTVAMLRSELIDAIGATAPTEES